MPALWIALLVVFGASGGIGAQQRPPHDSAIESLIADANSAPPEFAADALIRISSLPKVDHAWRRELLEDAYMRAYGAPEQYRRSTTTQFPVDSRIGAQVFAYATALTRVTLQVRAVQLMALVDPDRARELFEWIDLNLAPGSCADPLVPAVGEYYSTLGQLAGTTYPRSRSDALTFLQLYAWRAHLPSEMPALARAIQRFRSGPLEAAYFEGFFRQILQGSSADAPGFSSAALDIISRMTEWQIADTALGVPGSGVMDALRGYLVAQLKAPRCADNAIAATVPSAFNAAVRRTKAEFDVKLMDPDPAKTGTLGIARVDPYWQSPEGARLHDAAVRLHGPGAVPVPMRTRLTDAWRNQAERLLIDVEQWTGTKEPVERDYFYQKGALYLGLLDLMPASTVRSRALRSFADFMRHTETDVNRRMLWFAFVNRMLEMTRGPFREEVLTAMEDTHQPVLWLYAKLERATPARRPD